jgi:RimJ/RimL family protein N-acetyltransferase
MPAIVAPRLSDGEIGVRPIAPTDIPDIVAACRDPEIPRWTRVPSPYMREDAERFVAIAATEAAAGDGVALAVCDAARDRLIGTIGLMEVDHERGYAEIGYWTAAHERGRGAATRAVGLLRDWAHAELGLSRIEILAHRDNRPSQRVA